MSFLQWEEQQGAEVTEPKTAAGRQKTMNFSNISGNMQALLIYLIILIVAYVLICACLPYNSTNMRNKELPVRWVLAGNLKYLYTLPQIRLLS